MTSIYKILFMLESLSEPIGEDNCFPDDFDQAPEELEKSQLFSFVEKCENFESELPELRSSNGEWIDHLPDGLFDQNPDLEETSLQEYFTST